MEIRYFRKMCRCALCSEITMKRNTIMTRLMFISMGVLLLAVILDPENICRETPGYNWLFLIAPSIEILISVSMIFLVISKSNKSQKLENYLKVVIVLVITYMIVDAGISSYLRYSTKKVKSQNREKTELDAPYNQLTASLG